MLSKKKNTKNRINGAVEECATARQLQTLERARGGGGGDDFRGGGHGEALSYYCIRP
jgi:hypothetical protein